MRHGKLLKAGDKIFNKELANTLEIIAEAGNADPFYDGTLTSTIVQDIKAKGTWYLSAIVIPNNHTYWG